MRALFISDLHLCEQVPENTAAFLRFLEGPTRRAQALYILGDLFEYWAGDDDRTGLADTVAEALRGAACDGTQLYFVAGNRDFLLGERFAEHAGLTRLTDPTCIELDGSAFLLTHGDTLCTDDETYQRFRTQVRNPAWQQAFLAKPLQERRAMIEQLREHSESAKQTKALEIMDVNTAAVADAIRQNGYPCLIHGHTHRPGHHRFELDGRACHRWVLPDWHGKAVYLRWDGRALAFGEA